MIVGADRLLGRVQGDAEQFAGPAGEHLVDVHVVAGARAGPGGGGPEPVSFTTPTPPEREVVEGPGGAR